jgi:hypothetical protein
MSSDGSYVSFGGPAEGVLFFNSSGSLLWAGSVGGSGAPVSIFQSDSLALMYGCCNGEIQLVAYNGTVVDVETFYPEMPSAVAGSPNDPVWAVVVGSIGSPGLYAGTCVTLHVFNGRPRFLRLGSVSRKVTRFRVLLFSDWNTGWRVMRCHDQCDPRTVLVSGQESPTEDFHRLPEYLPSNCQPSKLSHEARPTLEYGARHSGFVTKPLRSARSAIFLRKPRFKNLVGAP